MLKKMILFFTCAMLSTTSMAQSSYLQKNDQVYSIGDSITAANAYDQYIQQVLQTIYPDAGITVINKGSGGARADFGVSTIKSYQPNDKPAFALFMFGVNDTGWNPSGQDAKVAAFLKNLRNAVDAAKEKQLPLIFMRETHFTHGANAGPDAFEVKASSILTNMQVEQSKFAVENKIPFIDVRSAYQKALDKAWAKDPAYEFTPDIIHPSSPGHAAMACEILRALGAGLHLSSGEKRGELHIDRSSDVELSLLDGAKIINTDDSITIKVKTVNKSVKKVEGTLLVVVAGQKFEKKIKVSGHRDTTLTFKLPAKLLMNRFDITPVYMAFISKDVFTANDGLLYYSRLQPSDENPVAFTAADFKVQGADTRTCPVTDLNIKRDDDLFTINFTWNDTTPVMGQTGFKERFGSTVTSLLYMKNRDGQPCDAVEFFFDLRPSASIGRMTSNIDDNPFGVLRVGVCQEIINEKPVVRVISEPAQPTDAVTITDLGNHKYRLTVKAKANGPIVGFGAKVTDNTAFKYGSTPPFYLTMLRPGTGAEPMSYVQLSDDREGVLYRMGY
jgi:lysophospholipase L1-like esterase